VFGTVADLCARSHALLLAQWPDRYYRYSSCNRGIAYKKLPRGILDVLSGLACLLVTAVRFNGDRYFTMALNIQLAASFL
jgi:hypothetical protein